MTVRAPTNRYCGDIAPIAPSKRLPQPQHVPVAIAEPGAVFAFALARVIARHGDDAVAGAERASVKFLELDAACPQLIHRRAQIGDVEGHLGECAGRLSA